MGTMQTQRRFGARRRAMLLAVVLAVLAGMPGAFSLPGTVHAAGGWTSAAGAKPRIITLPARQANQSGAHAPAVMPRAAAQGSGNLQYYSGSVQHSPVAYLIFWGSYWGSSSALAADAQVVKNYFSQVGATSFERMLTQYYSTSGGATTYISNTNTVGGVYVDSATAIPTDTTCGGATIQDSAIQAEVSAAITAARWATDSTNATYFVYTPPNDYVNDGSGDCSDAATAGAFCAYHGWSTSNNVAYAAMPYPFDAECQVGTSPNNNVAGDSLANVSSHEEFESITDPVPGSGWIDSQGYEIGDKCAWDFSSGLTHLNSGGTYELQTEYNNLTGTCINAYLSHLQVAPQPEVLVEAAPGTNAPTQAITLQNTGTAASSWSANTSGLPAWVSVFPTGGTLLPGASQTLSLSFATTSYTTPQTLSATLTLNDANADNAPANVPITLVLVNVSKTWYFAEGYTGGSFDEYLTVANPNSVPANLTVTYLLQGGQAPVVKQYAVAAGSRFTQNVRNDVGVGQSVAMQVVSDQPVVAERPMYFTFAGIPGGSDVLGATSLAASTYDFGYLDTEANAYTYLTILNTNSSTLYANVTYASQSGTLFTTQLAVPSNSRGTIDVNHDNTITTGAPLPQGIYSASVTLTSDAAGTQPASGGLVERPLYLLDPATGYPGAADVVGMAQPSTRWDFAEGFTGATNAPFHEVYALSNPSATQTITATVTLMRTDGSTTFQTLTLAPHTLQFFDVNNWLGTGVSNSAEVTAAVTGTNTPASLLAERVQSFDYLGDPGMTDVLGATAPGQFFAFAEGYTGPGFTEYLTVQNPDASRTAHVQVEFLPPGGSPTTEQYSIAPHARFTLNVGSVMPNVSLSLVLLSDVPVVAERPMYFNYANRQRGGTDVVGYQP